MSVVLFSYKKFLIDELSEDEDDEEELIVITLCQLNEKNIVNRTNNFGNVVKSFSDKEFQQNFRLTRVAFAHLYALIHDYLKKKSATGPDTIDPEKQVLATIWLLSTPDSYRSVGGRFDMGKASLSVSFCRVINALNTIAPNIIKWPSKEEARVIERNFYRLAKIPGVVGAIDGTYVPIKAPKENPQAYINRKCFHGITLQAVCDDKRRFTDVFTGFPSSVSDSRIFRNSSLYEEILTNKDLFFDQNQFIIGDKAYPLLDWCIPPYIDRGNLTQRHRFFNTSHAKTRQVIERTFALLFGRFRRLKYLDMNRTDRIPATILAACVLHNICLMFPDDRLDSYTREGQEFVVGDENLIQERFIPGNDLRNQIAEMLHN